MKTKHCGRCIPWIGTVCVMGGFNEFGGEKKFRMAWHIGRNTVHGPLISNEPAQFCNVALCTPAGIIHQRSIAERISEPLDILFQHLAQCGSSQSHLSASNTLSYATHNCYELIFELFGDASRDLFWLVIIRPSKAVSHGCAAWGACRPLVWLVTVL